MIHLNNGDVLELGPTYVGMFQTDPNADSSMGQLACDPMTSATGGHLHNETTRYPLPGMLVVLGVERVREYPSSPSKSTTTHFARIVSIDPGEYREVVTELGTVPCADAIRRFDGQSWDLTVKTHKGYECVAGRVIGFAALRQVAAVAIGDKEISILQS